MTGTLCRCPHCETGRLVREQYEKMLPSQHELKSWPSYFKAVADGVKRFEYRINDRSFKVGDLLLLREWLPDSKQYTGAEIQARITYMMDSGFALPDGYVILSIELI